MKHRVYQILLLILLCTLSSAITFAQDQSDVDQTDSAQPSDTGTPGLVNIQDNLNLPLIPPAPDAEPSPTTGQTPILPNTPTTPLTNQKLSLSDLLLVPSNIQTQVHATHWKNRHRTRAFRPLSIGQLTSLVLQQGDPILTYTYEKTGQTIYVYKDNSFELKDKDGTTWLTGYFGIVGDNKQIAIAKDTEGTSYAIADGYYSAFTRAGDVVVGNAFTAYLYDFDEDGNLLRLIDSDRGKYDVQVDTDGSISITGSDSYEAFADDTGAFELYNPDGDVVVKGELFDEGSDEFTAFDKQMDEAAASEIAPTDDAETVDTNQGEVVATEIPSDDAGAVNEDGS